MATGGRRPGTWRREPDDSGRYHSPQRCFDNRHLSGCVIFAEESTTHQLYRQARQLPAHCFFLPERAAFHNIISSRPHPQAALCCSSCCRQIWIARERPTRCAVDDKTTRLAPAPARVNDPTLLRPSARALASPPPPMTARAAVDDSALLSDAPWSSSQHLSTGRCTTADAPTTTPHRNSQPNRDEGPSFLPARLETSSL